MFYLENPLNTSHSSFAGSDLVFAAFMHFFLDALYDTTNEVSRQKRNLGWPGKSLSVFDFYKKFRYPTLNCISTSVTKNLAMVTLINVYGVCMHCIQLCIFDFYSLCTALHACQPVSIKTFKAFAISVHFVDK